MSAVIRLMISFPTSLFECLFVNSNLFKTLLDLFGGREMDLDALHLDVAEEVGPGVGFGGRA